MTQKKTIPAPRRPAAGSAQNSSTHHHLDALLHRVRCIAQYEDALCEVAHEVKRSGGLSAEIRDELTEILERMPSQVYLRELDAIREALAKSQPPANHASATAAKPASPGKESRSAKKTR